MDGDANGPIVTQVHISTLVQVIVRASNIVPQTEAHNTTNIAYDERRRRQTPGLPTPMSPAHLYRCSGMGSDVTQQVQDQAVVWLKGENTTIRPVWNWSHAN
jgi:hypothetical protein